MSKIENSALVLYSAEQMYLLVNNVKDYSDFVPGCDSTDIISESSEVMVARLNISQSGFSQSFTTQNHLIYGKEIRMTLVDGPFKTFVGVWRFQSLDETSCKIEVNLDFEFKSKMMGLAFGSAFKGIIESMMTAFITRAKSVYGE